MERRDIILREIDALGKILLWLKEKLEQEEGAAHIADETLLQELGFDIDTLIGSDTDLLSGINYDNMEQLANILHLLSEKEPNDDRRKALLSKSLALYNHVELSSPLASFYRISQIEQLESELQ